MRNMNNIKTKIIATIGPCSNSYEVMRKLHRAGMNVARINMSHATHRDAQHIIDTANKINTEQSAEFGPIGLLLDTQGPEIRTGINQSDIDLKVGAAYATIKTNDLSHAYVHENSAYST